jgi:hypothetical protein
MAPKRDEYLKFWRVSLKQLLGWSEEQISEWTEQFEQDLRDLEYEFVRQDPLAYIIPAVIPAEIQEKMSPGKLAKLHEEIRSAITGNPTIAMLRDLPDDQLPPLNWWTRLQDTISLGEQKGEILGNSNLDHFDWDAARKRVQDVLEKAALHPGDPPRWKLGERGKQQNSYLKYWKACLKKLLGWSEAQILEWAKQFEREMGDGSMFFYHEDPVYYIVPLFVPPEAHYCLSPKDLRNLERKIELVIQRDPMRVKFEELSGEEPGFVLEGIRLAQQRGEVLAPVNFDYYDWDAAKERIRTVLKEYGLQTKN